MGVDTKKITKGIPFTPWKGLFVSFSEKNDDHIYKVHVTDRVAITKFNFEISDTIKVLKHPKRENIYSIDFENLRNKWCLVNNRGRNAHER
jgi:hypothetical protein